MRGVGLVCCVRLGLSVWFRGLLFTMRHVCPAVLEFMTTIITICIFLISYLLCFYSIHLYIMLFYGKIH